METLKWSQMKVERLISETMLRSFDHPETIHA